ncbi:MAG: MarR family winged helix-turn-helix transcriptional regulator [Acidimicrobiales bacterium]
MDHADGPSDPVHRVVWGSIAALFMSNENHRRMHDVADEVGLTPGLVKSLVDLDPERARPMRELVNQWQCDASFVTVVVDGLEERGLIERKVLPSDRRVKTVELTAPGVAARERVLDALGAPRKSLGALNARERQQLARLLLKLAKAQIAADGLSGSSTRGWLSQLELGSDRPAKERRAPAAQR